MTKMMMIFGVDFVLVVLVVELCLICSMPIVWVFVIFSVVLALVLFMAIIWGCILFVVVELGFVCCIEIVCFCLWALILCWLWLNYGLFVVWNLFVFVFRC